MVTREPFVPLGVRAQVSPETFARRWPDRQPYTSPVVPEPLVRAVYLGEGDADHLPPNARKMARTAHAAGWLTLVSFAIGPVLAADGKPATDDVMGPGDGLTPTGKPKRTKIGETERPQQPTVYVRCFRAPDVAGARALAADRAPDAVVTGTWLGGDYASGKWTGAGWHAGVALWPWRKVDWAGAYALLSAWGTAGGTDA